MAGDERRRDGGAALRERQRLHEPNVSGERPVGSRPGLLRWARRFVSSVVASCPSEQLESLTWPATPAGETATLPCPAGQSGQKTRRCDETGAWEAVAGECSREERGN